jgi:hypothetical protein
VQISTFLLHSPFHPILFYSIPPSAPMTPSPTPLLLLIPLSFHLSPVLPLIPLSLPLIRLSLPLIPLSLPLIAMGWCTVGAEIS